MSLHKHVWKSQGPQSICLRMKLIRQVFAALPGFTISRETLISTRCALEFQRGSWLALATTPSSLWLNSCRVLSGLVTFSFPQGGREMTKEMIRRRKRRGAGKKREGGRDSREPFTTWRHMVRTARHLEHTLTAPSGFGFTRHEHYLYSLSYAC